MGKRYQAICRFLGINHFVADPSTKTTLKEASHYLIATPTDKHLSSISEVRQISDSPILCEKPIALGECPDIPPEVYMVNNYAFYPGVHDRKDAATVYDFYNCGPHGLAWDCIQLIHLANSTVRLHKKSPIWKCQINGVRLNRECLDLAYVEMIRAFWQRRTKNLWGKADITAAHYKAARFAAEN